MKNIHLGIAGFGTVGTGLAKIIEKNADWIEKRIDKKLIIDKILVQNKSKERSFLPSNNPFITDNYKELINDEQIDIIVELMGGKDLAYTLVKEALAAGKHVVTANKYLLAVHGKELFALASTHNVGLFYEASVAGGIPVIKTLRESLTGDKIEHICGILNGTANYILSEMTANGIDFKKALEQAQDLGYAESDPTFDIEGIDTAHKLIVLIRLAFGVDYPLEELPIYGISQITKQDIHFAQELGYTIKLLAHVAETDGKLEAGVFPVLMPSHLLLAKTDSNYNAISITGNAAGAITLHGQGAGDFPTGSAVLADILELAKHMHTQTQPDNTGFNNSPLQDAQILAPEFATSAYYFRFTVKDKPGVMASLSTCLAKHNISIAQAVQKGKPQDIETPIVFTTHTASTKDIFTALEDIDKHDFILKPTVAYRIF